jgi:hypothetical protein
MCAMMAGTLQAPASSRDSVDAALPLSHESVPAGTPCADCAQPITSQFLVRNGDTICLPCRERMNGSFREALALGLAASVASIGLYYLIYAVTGMLMAKPYRFVFIAVIAGVLVGSGVRRGARASSLLRYRWLSVVLTYVAIVATYAQALAEMPGVTSVFDAALRALYLPLVMIVGQKNLVTLVLLGFGLHEAWKFSAPPYVHVEGPFQAGLPEAERTSPAPAEPAT